MIWIVGWVGLAFLSVLLGDVWRLINPWNAVFALAELCCRRVRADAVLGFARRYPESLAAWPAFLLLVAFAWMELVWSGRNDPAALAVALAAYSALTFFGMALFGRQKWLAQGEMFTLVFGTFARFGPLAAIPQRPGIRVRMPAAGLLAEQPATFSMVALVVALLATVTFDGLLETPLWARVDVAVLDWASEPSFGPVPILREDQMVRLVRSVALVGFVLLFLAVYAVGSRLTAAGVGERTPRRPAACFAASCSRSCRSRSPITWRIISRCSSSAGNTSFRCCRIRWAAAGISSGPPTIRWISGWSRHGCSGASRWSRWCWAMCARSTSRTSRRFASSPIGVRRSGVRSRGSRGWPPPRGWVCGPCHSRSSSPACANWDRRPRSR